MKRLFAYTLVLVMGFTQLTSSYAYAGHQARMAQGLLARALPAFAAGTLPANQVLNLFRLAKRMNISEREIVRAVRATNMLSLRQLEDLRQAAFTIKQKPDLLGNRFERNFKRGQFLNATDVRSVAEFVNYEVFNKIAKTEDGKVKRAPAAISMTVGILIALGVVVVLAILLVIYLQVGEPEFEEVEQL